MFKGSLLHRPMFDLAEFQTHPSFYSSPCYLQECIISNQLEDLKVLKRSPDLLNNVKIGQGQLQLIMEQILFTICGGCRHFCQVT